MIYFDAQNHKTNSNYLIRIYLGTTAPYNHLYGITLYLHGLNMAHKFSYTPTSHQHLATYATLDALAALAAVATNAAMIWPIWAISSRC